jgi:hypothetical protein
MTDDPSFLVVLLANLSVLIVVNLLAVAVTLVNVIALSH